MTSTQSVQQGTPVSRSAAHQNNTKATKTKVKKWSKGSPRCQKLRKIDCSMLSSKFRKDTATMVQWQAALLIQVRTGHVPLLKHLHRVGNAESPTCSVCSTGDEMVLHCLLICPGYAAHRNRTDVTSECTALLGQKSGFRGVLDSGFSLCTAPTYYCGFEYF